MKKTDDTIFTVTVLHLAPGTRSTTRSRTWGWYSRFEEAERAVLTNATDMFEVGYYSHAVIEAVLAGVIALTTSEQWYKASYSRRRARAEPKVRRIAKPAALKRIVGFSMG